MTGLLALIALAVWLTCAIWLAAMCAIDFRRARRNNAAQEIAPWVNAPDHACLRLLPDEPRDAQILPFDRRNRTGGAA